MSILVEIIKIPQRIAELTQAVYALKTAIIANPCECIIGEGPDNEGGDGSTIPGQTSGGIEFTQPVVVDQRKCDAAHYIWDSIRMSLEWLEAYNVVELTGGSISAVLGLFGLFLATTGPFGALIIGIAGLALAIAILIVTTTLDLIDMVTVWTAGKADIICCLYNALNTDDAKTCVNDYLLSTELDSGEVFFIMQFLPTGVVSLLFADTDESAVFFDGYESDFDCAQCIEPNLADWMISPSHTLRTAIGGGPLGTGTVLNDGSAFVINSVQIVSPANRHAIMLIVSAHEADIHTNNWLVGAICKTTSGQIARNDGPSSGFNELRGASCRGIAGQGPCGGPAVSEGPGLAPGTMSNRICLYYERTSSFTYTFQVISPPTLCP